MLSAYKYRNFFSIILRKTKNINCHNVFYSTWFPIFLFYYSYFLPPFKDAKGFFLTCVKSLGNLFICHMRIIVNKFGNGFSFLGIQILRHKHIIKPWGRCLNLQIQHQTQSKQCCRLLTYNLFAIAYTSRGYMSIFYSSPL